MAVSRVFSGSKILFIEQGTRPILEGFNEILLGTCYVYVKYISSLAV